jgi:hypothetical protein
MFVARCTVCITQNILTYLLCNLVIRIPMGREEKRKRVMLVPLFMSGKRFTFIKMVTLYYGTSGYRKRNVFQIPSTCMYNKRFLCPLHRGHFNSHNKSPTVSQASSDSALCSNNSAAVHRRHPGSGGQRMHSNGLIDDDHVA